MANYTENSISSTGTSEASSCKHNPKHLANSFEEFEKERKAKMHEMEVKLDKCVTNLNNAKAERSQAQNELNAITNEIVGDLDKKIAEQEACAREKQEYVNQMRDDLRERADSILIWRHPSQEEYDTLNNHFQMALNYQRKAREMRKERDEKVKKDNRYIVAENKLNEKKRKEAEAQAALDAARAERRKLINDLEEARQCLLEKIRNAPGTSRIKKPLSAIARRDNPEMQAFLANGNTYNQDPNSYGGIFDLRNFSNGQNFRKTAKGKESEMGPSQSYYLRDYVFSDSMVASEDDKNYEKIQPLILSEFQPYEMITVADVIGGIGDMVSKLVNSTVGMFVAPIIKTAGKCIQNSLINKYSKNTSGLYKTEGRIRKYFTTDPVQTVQNMFNGGKWLNTYELPYYGRRIFKSNLF